MIQGSNGLISLSTDGSEDIFDLEGSLPIAPLYYTNAR